MLRYFKLLAIYQQVNQHFTKMWRWEEVVVQEGVHTSVKSCGIVVGKAGCSHELDSEVSCSNPNPDSDNDFEPTAKRKK